MDSDGDGLSDAIEEQLGTNVNGQDTDGDGYTDALEAWAGYSPTSTRPDRIEKSIYVNLDTQRLEPRVANVALASYVVSSGVASRPTPTGAFRTLSKNPRAWSRSAKLWMPWWMMFDTRGYGLHELPEWPSGYKEGVNHLGKPASHGCVRLGVENAKTLYDFAPIGTKVLIERPSKTAKKVVKK